MTPHHPFLCSVFLQLSTMWGKTFLFLSLCLCLCLALPADLRRERQLNPPGPSLGNNNTISTSTIVCEVSPPVSEHCQGQWAAAPHQQEGRGPSPVATTTSIDPQVPAERGRDATTGGLRGGTTAAEASDGKHRVSRELPTFVVRPSLKCLLTWVAMLLVLFQSKVSKASLYFAKASKSSSSFLLYILLCLSFAAGSFWCWCIILKFLSRW